MKEHDYAGMVIGTAVLFCGLIMLPAAAWVLNGGLGGALLVGGIEAIIVGLIIGISSIKD